MDDAVISLEKILKANKKLIKNKIFNIVGENLKKSDLIKRVSKILRKKIKLKVKKVSLDKRDYKVSGRKFIKMFGKMKYGRINPAIIEVYNSVKNGHFYNPYSKKHTAVKEK